MGKSKMGSNMLKISEVSSASGVSVQTIHYYLREGLLTSPVKTARNMAYYHPVVVDEIRMIKELQDKRYLPIAVIKTILQARREGQELDHVEEMQSLFQQVFCYPEEEGESADLSEADVAAATGLDESALRYLEELRILNPAGKGGKHYDKSDLRAAGIVKKLLDLGLTPQDLVIYRQFAEFINSEVKTVRSRVLQRIHDGSISLTELTGILNDLKKQIAYKSFRRALFESWRQDGEE
ncbi:MAG: MerR family transcriptional regulator [Bacillota bacterium]